MACSRKHRRGAQTDGPRVLVTVNFPSFPSNPHGEEGRAPRSRPSTARCRPAEEAGRDSKAPRGLGASPPPLPSLRPRLEYRGSKIVGAGLVRGSLHLLQ